MLTCLDSPSPSPSLHSMQTWHWGQSQKPPKTCWRLRGLHTADLQPPGSTWQAALGGIVGLTKVGHQYFFLTFFFSLHLSSLDIGLHKQIYCYWLPRLWDAAEMQTRERNSPQSRQKYQGFTQADMCDRFLLLFFASVTHMHDKCIRIAGSNAVPRFHVGVTDTLPRLIQIEKSYCDAIR